MYRINALFFTGLSPQSAGALPRCTPTPERCVAAGRCWTVAGGTAMRFTASAPGALRVSSGRIWLTFSRPGRIDRYGQVTTSGEPAGCCDDRILHAGQSVRLVAGESVVLKPFSEEAGTAAGLQWRSSQFDG